MNKAFVKEIVRLGGDPADEVWTWLVQRGPHGPSFTWGQARSDPAGYVAVVHLERIVMEMVAVTPDFRDRARRVVRQALGSEMGELVLRAIQVAGVVGGLEELEKIRTLMHSEDAATAAHARACAFYLKQKQHAGPG